MILYLKWLQNVLQCSHRNDCWCRFHFHLPPNPILKVVVLVALPLFLCFLPFTPDGSEFAFTHFPITIESVSLFQSAILTKRSNSLLAVHVLLTQQHAFRFYLHLPQIKEVTDAYSVKECVSWRLNNKVSINKWAPMLLLFVTYKNCLSTIILKEATHMCQFF